RPGSSDTVLVPGTLDTRAVRERHRGGGAARAGRGRPEPSRAAHLGDLQSARKGGRSRGEAAARGGAGVRRRDRRDPRSVSVGGSDLYSNRGAEAVAPAAQAGSRVVYSDIERTLTWQA